MVVPLGETEMQQEARMALDYYIEAKGFDESLIGGYFPAAAADPVLAGLIVERSRMMAESEFAIRQRLEQLRDGCAQ